MARRRGWGDLNSRDKWNFRLTLAYMPETGKTTAKRPCRLRPVVRGPLA